MRAGGWPVSGGGVVETESGTGAAVKLVLTRLIF